ncbi:phenazine biosynthesis-like domain-containing protein 1 [Physella acuta]|uniref:phenazine biosynthesis-like domain-containing protein 1 n=1 Tax=Physella acuta TaxID=109671 RepID=UPI0027DE913D|nr:phenazine biosynthesis-like domain-containing protein 1 [Physella acuta]
MALTKNCLDLPIFIVDAFTNRQFSGNPAAVCLLSKIKTNIGCDVTLTDEQMQMIGREMNLSETAFVSPKEGDFISATEFFLRWFTPTTEVDLCGHATLATSAVLFHELGNPAGQLTFSTKSGDLSVNKSEDREISLNFPLNQPFPKSSEEFSRLIEVCLGDAALIVKDVQLSATGKLLLRLSDETTRDQLEKLKPNLDVMARVESTGLVKGVGITVKGSLENNCVDSEGKKYDFVSRYFAPWLGVNEDPVTGAWHTVVAPYWAKELNKNSLYARQCSTRGGDLRLQVEDKRVIISGKAVVNLRGTFTVQL